MIPEDQQEMKICEVPQHDVFSEFQTSQFSYVSVVHENILFMFSLYIFSS